MKRAALAPNDWIARPHHLWAKQWLLLAAGDFAAGDYNCMTVAWGSLGFIWNKPFAQVAVRPGRYTREFMDRFDSFTLCAFPESRRKALQVLGSKSGREGDKIAEAGLTPMASTLVDTPCFAEAERVIECRKMYWQDIDPNHFVEPTIADLYAERDYHRIYFGEILAMTAAVVPHPKA